MLMEQIDKHADLMAYILAGIAGGMVTKSMRDFIVKAVARRPGEVWQTNGRWYRKEGTRTVRIPKPGSEAEKKPAKAPKQAKPSKADLYASAKDAVAKLRGGDPGSIDEAMASLSALTVPELRKLAKESGLTKVPGRLKREIVEGLRDGIKASGGSVAGEPGTPSDAKAIKLTSEPLKELASEVAEKHGATVKGGELHTTYEQALEMISTLNDEGPRDGDVNADGLVFRNGRWHRDDNLEVIEPVSEKPGPTPAVTDTITVEEPDERAAESDDGRRAELERTGSGDAPRTGRRDSRILTDREQHTGPANLGLVPEHLRQHLREHQQFGVAKCIAAMDAHGGVLNADGTGVGKSRENLAVADYYARQGKKVVIVAPKGVIKCDWKKGTYAGSYKQDGEAMGVVPVLHGGDSPLTAGQIAMTTYDRIGKLKEHVGTDTVVIFDESHALKNSNSQRGKHGRDIMFKADKVLYATASPADKPLHVAHLLRAGVFGGGDGGKFWGKSADTYRKLGLREEEIYNRHSGQTIKKWGVDPRVGHAECARRMSGLFDQMTKDGLMFQRSLSMDNVDASVHHVQLSSEAAAEVEAAFNRSMSDNDGNKAVAIMAMRRAQEPHKIAAVVDHVKTELAAGRAPIIFLNRVNDNVEDDNDEDDDAIPDENTARLLREALIAAGIPEKDIGELHGAATKTPDAQRKAMDHFNGGKTKVLISTLQSGGVGVNLDDTVGDRPRTIVMMTPPLSANDMLQAAGRINRLSTMSDAKIISLVSDHKVDQWNMKLLGKKMKTMGAVLGKGFDVLLDGGKEVVEPEPFDWGGSLIRSQRGDTPKAATQTVSITGNTFDHKDRIRAAGGRWNADLKAWSIPVDKVESIRNLRGLNFSDQPQSPPVVSQQLIQAEPPTPKYISQAQKEAIHQALQQLAGNDPDRASERNAVGFNKMDSEFGTTLANSPSLTDRQAEAGAKLLAKYHRQLSPELHARATTFDERPEGMPFSNPPDVTTAPNATKYHVSGNTFAHKDRIRAAGGKWDGANKVWVIPASAKDRIANLPGLKFTGKRLKSPIYVMKAMGEQSESLAMLDALADILGGLYGKDALKHIPGLNRTPISKTYCILDGEVYRWSDGMLYKRLDGVWKASRHKPGEEWETRGRFYRREQGRTVRISKPGGKAIAVASDGAAEGKQAGTPVAPKASKESAREAAKAKIAEIAKGGKSPESHKELMANLGKLTVVDLKAIAKEHNLKAPPMLKAALMQKLADHIGLKKTDPVSYEAIRKMRLEHAGTKESKGPRSEPTVDVAKFHAQLDSLLAESPKERKVKPVEKEKLRARNASDMLTEPESLMPANAKKKAKQAPSEDNIKLDLPVIKTPIRAKANKKTDNMQEQQPEMTAAEFAEKNPPESGYEYVYRLQPQGKELRGHKSMTSNDEPDQRGVHVFGTIEEVNEAPKGWVKQKWKPEIVTIKVKRGHLKDNGDYEGYVVNPDNAEIVHRQAFKSWDHFTGR